MTIGDVDLISELRGSIICSFARASEVKERFPRKIVHPYSHCKADKAYYIFKKQNRMRGVGYMEIGFK